VHRLEVFGKDAQRTRIVAVQESLVLIGDWLVQLIDCSHVLWRTAAKSMKPRATSV
jgi:hypothetical protein